MSLRAWFITLTVLINSSLLFILYVLASKYFLPRRDDALLILGGCECAGFFLSLLLAKFLTLNQRSLSQLALLGLSLVVFSFTWSEEASAELGLIIAAGAVLGVLAGNVIWLITVFHEMPGNGTSNSFALIATVALGQMMALIGYPVLIEPNSRLGMEFCKWALAMLAIMLVRCATIAFSSAAPSSREKMQASVDRRPGLLKGCYWLALAATATSLVRGGSDYINSEISPIPLLGLLFIGLYVFALLAAFSQSRSSGPGQIWFELVHKAIAGLVLFILFLFLPMIVAPVLSDWRFQVLAALATAFLFQPYRIILCEQPIAVAVLLFLIVARNQDAGVLLVYLHLLVFFLQARMCFGQMHATQPDARYLVEFLFWSSVGGVAGIVLNQWLAPLLFQSVTEYPIALILACLLRPGGSTAGLPDRLAFSRFGPRLSESLRRRWSKLFDLLVPGLIGLLAWFYFAELGDGSNSSWLLAAIPFIVCLISIDRPVRFALSLAAVYVAHVCVGPAPDMLQLREYFGLPFQEKRW